MEKHMPEVRKSRFGNAWRIAALAMVLLSLFGSLACTQETNNGEIKVVATIFPLADFVKNVGGDKVEVIPLLPAGASPHAYDLKVDQVKNIAEAKLFVMNGLGLDSWIGDKVKAAASPDLVVVDTSIFVSIEGLLLTGHEQDHGHEESHQGVNPHIWLDPVLAQKQVEAIAQGLIMLDPANSGVYITNAAAYIDKLQSLDEEIQASTDNFSQREFIAFHPAWTYFANRYGLIEAAVIEESPGDDSAWHTRKVIDVARQLNIKAIFAELQFNSERAHTIAEEIGGEVLFLDPIGGADLEGRDSYIELMRYNVEQMTLAME
jgi:zinc transport system substrate-binding protein